MHEMAISRPQFSQLQCPSGEVNGHYRSTGRRLVRKQLSAAVAIIPGSEILVDAAIR
jgi:hypothetical protein